MPSNLLKPQWNSNFSALRYGASAKSKKAAGALALASLRPFAKVDGKVLAPSKWEATSKTSAKASLDGFDLELVFKSSGAVSLKLSNKSGRAVRLDRLAFNASRGGEADFLSIPGPRLRFFREGWAMPSPTGSVRYGEADFLISDGYKAFAVPSPSEYDGKAPNKFSGEYVGVLNDSESGASLLLGFISSADQFTRVATELEGSGVKSLSAVCHFDGAELAPGDSVESEELVVLASFDGYGLLEEFASLWGKRMKAIFWKHTPTGWCSWYFYFDKITEAAMIENIDWMKAHKAEFPLEYVQMDDGYQSFLGDWLLPNEKFPKGLPYLAESCRKAGFKPGIWLAPFMVEDRSKLYAEHPDWMVKDKSGQTVWAMEWRGSRVAILDCSLQAPCDWLAETFAALVKMGYEYAKVDFIAQECGVISMGGVYANPKLTRAQVLRRGLQAIRKGLGDKLLMGCTCPLGPETGIVNAARIGTDITPYWGRPEQSQHKESPQVPHVCRNLIARRYMHRRLWLNDPDTHIARIDNNELTESEVKLWTAAILLTGGSLMLSDRFSTLAPERAALSKMLVKELDKIDDTRPLDLFDREFPALWLGRRKGSKGELALGVFNFGAEKASFKADLSKAGVKSGAKFKATELWAGADLGALSTSFETEVEPHSCKVLLLKPA